MGRLDRYLFRTFSIEALTLFSVAAFLLFLVQCLRLFDLVTDRSQGLDALIGQALLGMPSLSVLILYVCFGIALGRALRSLQARYELQVIHASALVGSLARSIAAFALGGAVVVLNWTASIAADLVSRSMVPNRFTEVFNGVSMSIRSRDIEGRITGFFADDRRDPALQRTYFADSAIITRDELGYVLRMQDGAIQQMTPDGRFSEVSFSRYDLALDKLAASTEPDKALNETTSFEIVGHALSGQELSRQEFDALVRRTAEGVRVIALCLFVGALGAFPTGRRGGFRLPIELTAMAFAFIERGITTYAPLPKPWDSMAGSLVLIFAGIVILLVRHGPPLRRKRPEAAPA
jgi:lipopolysaccharide export system permease protein